MPSLFNKALCLISSSLVFKDSQLAECVAASICALAACVYNIVPVFVLPTSTRLCEFPTSA
jgi:hypothetical protein